MIPTIDINVRQGYQAEGRKNNSSLSFKSPQDSNRNDTISIPSASNPSATKLFLPLRISQFGSRGGHPNRYSHENSARQNVSSPRIHEFMYTVATIPKTPTLQNASSLVANKDHQQEDKFSASKLMSSIFGCPSFSA
jgi:hypothetical protein